jgi:Tol biopolymer transport system component
VRASTSAGGEQGNGRSGDVFSLSADGTAVTFTSTATNLVPGDTNGVGDIFVKDLATGAITRANTSVVGGQASAGSFSGHPALSRDGTKVAFASTASNLVPGDANGRSDVFVKDLVTGAITRVSTSATGEQGNGDSSFPVLSADNSKVAFASTASNLVPGDASGPSDVFVKDLVTGVVTPVSISDGGLHGDGASYDPVLSAGGDRVAFQSEATNLVPGDTNRSMDAFVRDLGGDLLL